MQHPFKDVFFLVLAVLYLGLILSESFVSINIATTGYGDAIAVLRCIDFALLVVFALDTLARFSVEGFRYFKNIFNVVDTLVILFSLLSLGHGVINDPTRTTILPTHLPQEALLRFFRFMMLFYRLQRFEYVYYRLHQRRSSSKYASNLERALIVLKNLKNNTVLNDRVRRDIDWISHVIQNNDLHNPVLLDEMNNIVTRGKSNVEVSETKETNAWVLENFSSNQVATSPQKTQSGTLVTQVSVHKMSGAGVGKALTLRKQSERPSDDLTDDRGDFIVKLINTSKLSRDDINMILVDVNEWNFDIFEVDRITKGHPILFIAYAVFKNYSLYETFNIDESVVRRYFAATEAGYRVENEYHSNVHAADVMQNVHCFLLQDEFRNHLLAHDVLGLLIAAAIHDYDHPGVNNNFLIQTKSDVALLYNDKSVLENHHVAGGFHLMIQEDRNILSSLAKDVALEVRESIILMVLATDIKFHFEELGKFNAYMLERRENHKEGVLPLKDRHLLLKLALHTADVANPAKPLEIVKIWTDRVMSEFFSQGDREKQLGLPVSQFMDRKDETAKPRCQIAFITYIVGPTFDAWGQLCIKLLPTFQANLEATLSYWKTGPGSITAPNPSSKVLPVVPSSTPSPAANPAQPSVSIELTKVNKNDTKEDSIAPAVSVNSTPSPSLSNDTSSSSSGSGTTVEVVKPKAKGGRPVMNIIVEES